MEKSKKIEEIELEKIKTKLDVLIKVKEELNNRISFLSERIGELRSMLVDKEKELKELEANVQKYIQLVKELEPEEIIKKFKEFETKIEVINSKLELNESLINKMIEEIKEMRRVFIKFRSLEEIQKIENELKKDLNEIKKVESKVSTYSAKTESIFSELNRKYGEYTKLKNKKRFGNIEKHNT